MMGNIKHILFKASVCRAPKACAALSLILILAAISHHALADSSATMYVSTGNSGGLHLRAKPSRSAASLCLYDNGTAVTVFEVVQSEGKEWARVTVAERSGYMQYGFLSSAQPTPVPTPAPAQQLPETPPFDPQNTPTPFPEFKPYDRWISTDGHAGEWMHAEPYDESEKLMHLPDGTKVTCLWSTGGYRHVEVNGVQGYIIENCLTFDPDIETYPANSYGDGEVFYVNGNGQSVPLFHKKDTSASISCVVPDGGKVYAYGSVENGWVYVRVSNGLLGFIQTKHLSEKPVKTVEKSSVAMYLAEDGSLREKPYSGAPAIQALALGTAVKVMSMNGFGNYEYSAWAFVSVDGRTGYVQQSKLSYEPLLGTPRPTDAAQSTAGPIETPAPGTPAPADTEKDSAALGKSNNGKHVGKSTAPAGAGMPDCRIVTLGTVNTIVSYGSETETVPTRSLPLSKSVPADRALAVIWAPRTGRAALRKSARENAEFMKQCKTGRIVIVLETGGKFSRILYKDTEGYIRSDCLHFYPVSDQSVTNGILSYNGHTNGGTTVNIRLEPEGYVIDDLSTGTAVSVLAQGDKWTEIEANGIRGFVLNEFLTVSQPETSW